MNEDFSNVTKTNRFIFSDDFYDKLDEIPLEEPVSFDAPIRSIENIPKVEEKEVPVNEVIPIDPKVEIDSTPPVEESIHIPRVEYINQEVLENEKKEEVSELIPVVESKTEEELPVNIELSKIEETPVNFVKMDSIPSVENPVEDVNVLETKTIEPESHPKEFDIETGINTNLEQELLKSKIEMENRNKIVDDYSSWEPKKQEKTVYRATRNQPQEIPIWLRDDVELPVYQPPKVVTDTSVYIQPEIINIDEEILKEAEDITVSKEEFDYDGNIENAVVLKSNLLEELKQKEQETGKISILARYGEDFCSRDYVTNPAIGRKEEIKQVNLILLTPEKSAILVGKPGIGKTSIVEGLAYQLQRNNVPDALKGYRIISIKTTSLLGTLPTGETRLQTLIDELKELDKVILFMDEIHMLMGATSDSSLDFANMFKESLGRGSIKMIGATTSDEYERYVLRDKAFVRRFQRVDVEEPTKEQTIKILMGTLPKIEKNTGAVLKYSEFVQTEIMSFIVDITTEYKRVYGIGSRYPDICLTLLSQAFSQAVFDNRKEVNIMDIRKAIENSKNIYPDVIKKELIHFDEKFSKLIQN